MKKIIALVCLLSMLLPLCACSSSLATEETKTLPATAETKTEETKKDQGEIVYPDSFAVGFSRVDITPQTPIPIYNTTATGVHDPLWLSCTFVGRKDRRFDLLRGFLVRQRFHHLRPDEAPGKEIRN